MNCRLTISGYKNAVIAGETYQRSIYDLKVTPGENIEEILESIRNEIFVFLQKTQEEYTVNQVVSQNIDFTIFISKN